MFARIIAAGLASALVVVPALAQDQAEGPLVMVGGALRASNEAVNQRFLEAAGGAETARIGVIPAASGKPHRNAQKFLDDMAALGVAEDRLTILPIAVKDDSGTEEVDESTWADGGKAPEIARQIEEMTGIWMIGGDQMRLRQTLLDENGRPLPAAQAMKAVRDRGGVIGGTSAGAAIMSDIMIASGDSMGALTKGFTDDYGSMDEQEYGPVHLNRGLGLFPHGVVDQHFDRKARYGRLIATLHEKRETTSVGFGIEENTAMVVDGDTAEAIGTGGVHVVDVGEATRTEDGGYRNVRLGFFQEGDRWSFTEGLVNASEKYPTIGGDEYFNTPDPVNTGVFSRNSDVKDLIGYDLVDNKGASEVRSFLFDPETGRGFRLTFSQDDRTQGYWKALDGQADSYAYSGVRLDITPVTVTIDQ